MRKPEYIKTEEDKQKFVTLVSWGIDPNTIGQTWAWDNFEEAKGINKFFDDFISTVRGTIN